MTFAIEFETDRHPWSPGCKSRKRAEVPRRMATMSTSGVAVYVYSCIVTFWLQSSDPTRTASQERHGYEIRFRFVEGPWSGDGLPTAGRIEWSLSPRLASLVE